MYLERLFANAGKQIDSGLIQKIIDQVQPVPAEKAEGEEETLSAREQKNREKELEKKREQMQSMAKDSFKRFVAAIKKNKYHAAVTELIEMAYLMPGLNTIADFHALLTLNYVALRKYYPAEQEENNARRLNPAWEIFDKIADNAYESGVFFLAEYMRTSARSFKEDKKIVEDLHWDEPVFKTLIEDLGTICSLENEAVWKSIQEEEIKFDKFEAGATLEDLIVQICDLFVLPFYSRLELSKMAEASKLDENNK